MSDLKNERLSFELDTDATEIIEDVVKSCRARNFIKPSQGFTFEFPLSSIRGDHPNDFTFQGVIDLVTYSPLDQGLYARFSFDLSHDVEDGIFCPEEPTCIWVYREDNYPLNSSWVRFVRPNGMGSGYLYLGNFSKYTVSEIQLVRVLNDSISDLVLDFS